MPLSEELPRGILDMMYGHCHRFPETNGCLIVWKERGKNREGVDLDQSVEDRLYVVRLSTCEGIPYPLAEKMLRSKKNLLNKILPKK